MATRSTQEKSPSGVRVGLTPVSLFMVLLLFWIMTQVQLVLVLGLLALLFGTILEGPVRFFEQQRFPRPAAILAVYIIIIGALALLMVAIVPAIADQASGFSEDVPGQLRELRDEWRTSGNGLLNGPGVGVLDRAIESFDGNSDVSVSQDTVDRAIPVLTSITGGLVSTITLLVITFYYLLEKRLLRRLILDTMTPRPRARVDTLWTEVENKVGRWMRGQLLLCLIIGTIATVSYGIIGLNFWPLLGLWAGVTEIIPIVGPWIGGVPAVLIALTMGWKTAIFTVAVIVGMQTLENWVLVPRVMRGAVGLTPLTVFVAILAGTQLLGVVGAVLAIPIAATIQVILTDFLERRASRDERMTARSGWRWMLSRSGMREGEEVEDEAAPDRRWSAVDDRDDEAYVAQQESESFNVTYGPEDEAARIDEYDYDDPDRTERDMTFDDEDEQGGSAPAVPVEPAGSATAPEPGQPGEPDAANGAPEPAPEADERDDDSPAFAAWPRTDKDRKRPPSSTWPPLEEGRPERLRRRRRDPEPE
jgi:predicted PurR-regulated permease PerM